MQAEDRGPRRASLAPASLHGQHRDWEETLPPGPRGFAQPGCLTAEPSIPGPGRREMLGSRLQPLLCSSLLPLLSSTVLKLPSTSPPTHFSGLFLYRSLLWHIYVTSLEVKVLPRGQCPPQRSRCSPEVKVLLRGCGKFRERHSYSICSVFSPTTGSAFTPSAVLGVHSLSLAQPTTFSFSLTLYLRMDFWETGCA